MNTKIAIIAGAIVLLLGIGLGWNYTEAVKEKNAIEREKVASTERISAADRDAERLKQEAGAQATRDAEMAQTSTTAALERKIIELEKREATTEIRKPAVTVKPAEVATEDPQIKIERCKAVAKASDAPTQQYADEWNAAMAQTSAVVTSDDFVKFANAKIADYKNDVYVACLGAR